MYTCTCVMWLSTGLLIKFTCTCVMFKFWAADQNLMSLTIHTSNRGTFTLYMYMRVFSSILFGSLFTYMP